MTVIFIECGTAMASPFNTGIQRVVRNIVRESEAVGHSLGHQCIPVRFAQSHFYVIEPVKAQEIDSPVVKVVRVVEFAILVDKILQRILHQKIYKNIRRIVAPYIQRLHRQSVQESFGLDVQDILEENNYGGLQQPTYISPPVLLLLDSTWDMQMWTAVDEFRAMGGHVAAVLYDLIPFTHPDTVEEHTRNAHTSWWMEAPLHLDSVLCISQTVRGQFLKWQEESRLDRRVPAEKVTYFYLGSELRTDDDDDQFPNIFIKDDPYFLVVGSIEPRKNHLVILDAFEKLWREGMMVNLVIVGGNGWKSEVFLTRVKAHPMFKQRLFLLRRTTDAELGLLYSKARALIIASFAEGFGLPIVEAFQRGVRVICSDIPVFREIAGQRATYFDPHNSIQLADKLSAIIEDGSIDQKMPKDAGSWLTWRESTEQLFTSLVGLSVTSPEEDVSPLCGDALFFTKQQAISK